MENFMLVDKKIFELEGINNTEKVLLMAIGEETQKTNRELGEYANVSNSIVTKSIGKMKRLGYIDMWIEYHEGSKQVKSRTIKKTY